MDAVHRRARISKQSESQLPVVAAIGVHCPHNCRASLLRTVPGTDEVDGSAAGVRGRGGGRAVAQIRVKAAKAANLRVTVLTAG